METVLGYTVVIRLSPFVGVTDTLNTFYATKRQPLLFFNEKCGLRGLLPFAAALLAAAFCASARSAAALSASAFSCARALSAATLSAAALSAMASCSAATRCSSAALLCMMIVYATTIPTTRTATSARTIPRGFFLWVEDVLTGTSGTFVSTRTGGFISAAAWLGLRATFFRSWTWGRSAL